MTPQFHCSFVSMHPNLTFLHCYLTVLRFLLSFFLPSHGDQKIHSLKAKWCGVPGVFLSNTTNQVRPLTSTLHYITSLPNLFLSLCPCKYVYDTWEFCVFKRHSIKPNHIRQTYHPTSPLFLFNSRISFNFFFVQGLSLRLLKSSVSLVVGLWEHIYVTSHMVGNEDHNVV